MDVVIDTVNTMLININEKEKILLETLQIELNKEKLEDLQPIYLFY